MKNSSSRLLIGNCDEFIFYDDIIRQRVGRLSRSAVKVPNEKRDLFDFLVKTVQSLLMESRGVLYSSLIKDTMKRKQPDFNERTHGYSTFGDLLEEARGLGLLDVERDAAAGGTWVVRGLGKGIALEKAGNGNEGGRPSRRRRRSGRGGTRDRKETAPAEVAAKSEPSPAERQTVPKTEKEPAAKAAVPKSGDKPVAKKAPAKKKAAKKAPAKKTPASKTTTKKTTAKKPVTKKTTKKKSTKKTTKAPVKKTGSKAKTSAPKTSLRKKTARKS